MNVRLVASRVVNEVSNGRSLSDCLANELLRLKDSRDRGFVQAVSYGVCRYYERLDFILSLLLEKPMQTKDTDVHALILVGLYQLMDMRVPSHAAVSETVNATVKLDKAWARGFTNAMLREYLRHKDEIDAEVENDIEAKYSHPGWMIDAIKKAWPDQWQDILNANNVHPPFVLRVNQKLVTREKYLEKLAEKELAAVIVPETKHGIVLESSVQVDELPGFAAGEVSVQDGATQLAADLMMLEPGQHVLDACAAPGGKLTHLLECQPELASCVAVEKDKQRIALIEENLQRLNLKADCICDDVANTKAWWNKQLFDRILLDAPCSASGVIRRHPDIKLLRQSTDIAGFAKEQTRLLEALWPLLQEGGVLVYATCSIFPEENTNVVQKFLAAHADAKEEVIDAKWGVACKVGRQILPGMHGMDGFYYARIRKAVTAK